MNDEEVRLMRIRDLEQIIDEEKALRKRARILLAALGVAFLRVPTTDHWDEALALEVEAELIGEEEHRTESISQLSQGIEDIKRKKDKGNGE